MSKQASFLSLAISAICAALFVAASPLLSTLGWSEPSWIDHNPATDHISEVTPTACLAGGWVWAAYYGSDYNTKMNFIGYVGCSIDGSGLNLQVRGRITDETPNDVSAATFLDDWPAMVTDGNMIWVFYRHIIPGKRAWSYTIAYRTALVEDLPGQQNGEGPQADGVWGQEMIVPIQEGLSRAGTPSATFVSPDQIWLAYTGRVDAVTKGQKGNFNNDIYLKKGTIQGGTIDWGTLPDQRMTQGPESDMIPSILYADGKAWLVYQSDLTGEKQLYSMLWDGTSWSAAQPVTIYGSTDYMMYPKLAWDGSVVWLYYESKWANLAAKYFDQQGWSNKITISEENDDLSVPVPVIDGADAYTYLIVEKFDYGAHLAYTGGTPQPVAPGCEVRVVSADYNAAQGTIKVAAESSQTGVRLYLYCRADGDPDYTFIGEMRTDNTYEGTVGFAPSWAMVSDQSPFTASAAIDMIRVRTVAAKPGKGR